MANSNGWGDGAANNAIGWGQGANNNIGWGDSHAKSWAGLTDIVGLTTDTDAQAFITAAAITDATQQSAIDTLVKGMKADGIWTKMKAIYPFVGGTATTHKWNLKDPRDLDAAFRLVFNGGWTHSSTGATPNGTNGYANTFFAPLTQNIGLNSFAFGVYCRNDITSKVAFGLAEPLKCSYVLAKSSFGLYNGVNDNETLVTPNWTTGTGLFTASRTSSTEVKLFQNTSVKTRTAVSAGRSSLNMYLGCQNDSFAGATNYSAIQFGFNYISDGLTDTEAANLYTRVQAFQTSLSRQV